MQALLLYLFSTYHGDQFLRKENLELIDLFNDKTFSEETEDIMQPNDGLHFGEVGYQALADIIYNHIKKYL